MSTFSKFAAAALLAICAGAPQAAAQNFYAGKRITLTIGSGVGGNYDLYGRLLAENIGRFIPGNPTVISENRVGAASRVAMGYLYAQAPKDGTAMGTGTNLLAFDQFVFPDAARQFDVTKFQWIGNMASLNGVIAIWHTTGVKTLEDAKRIPVVIGANSRASETFIIPAVLNHYAGTQLKIVHGYPGNTSEIDLAIEKGEVFGRGGSWTSHFVAHPDWVHEGKIHAIVQNGPRRDPRIPDVPLLTELAQNEEQRMVYNLILSGSLFSRAFMMAPEVPADRVAIIRKAFMDMVNDKGFVAMAEKRGFEITPSTADELTKVISDLQSNIKPEYTAQLRAVLQQ